MSIAKQYTAEIAQGLLYLPTWLPLRTLSLGDVGVIKDNIFETQSTLEAMNVPFARSASQPTGAMRYNSHDGVSTVFKVAGSAPAVGSALATADAGVSIKFSRAEAVVFEANGCTIEAISDLANVGDQLVKRYQAKKWNPEFYVITEVVKAHASTILISSGSSAAIELRAGGKLEAAGFSLADLNAQFKVVSTNGMGFEIVSHTKLSPLFKAWRVRPRFWRTDWEKYHLQDEAQVEEGEDEMPVFSPMSVSDLWPT